MSVLEHGYRNLEAISNGFNTKQRSRLDLMEASGSNCGTRVVKFKIGKAKFYSRINVHRRNLVFACCNSRQALGCAHIFLENLLQVKFFEFEIVRDHAHSNIVFVALN